MKANTRWRLMPMFTRCASYTTKRRVQRALCGSHQLKLGYWQGQADEGSQWCAMYDSPGHSRHPVNGSNSQCQFKCRRRSDFAHGCASDFDRCNQSDKKRQQLNAAGFGRKSVDMVLMAVKPGVQLLPTPLFRLLAHPGNTLRAGTVALMYSGALCRSCQFVKNPIPGAAALCNGDIVLNTTTENAFCWILLLHQANSNLGQSNLKPCSRCGSCPRCLLSSRPYWLHQRGFSWRLEEKPNSDI